MLYKNWRKTGNFHREEQYIERETEFGPRMIEKECMPCRAAQTLHQKTFPIQKLEKKVHLIYCILQKGKRFGVDKVHWPLSH